LVLQFAEKLDFGWRSASSAAIKTFFSSGALASEGGRMVRKPIDETSSGSLNMLSRNNWWDNFKPLWPRSLHLRES
jgi:hypothetical protein